MIKLVRVLFALSAGMIAACSFGNTPSSAPNIILILVDDQGWTGTSLQMDDRIKASKSGLYRTPALERLAEQGAKFSNGYSSAPNCSPSRMSIQTGKSAARLGSTDITAVHPQNFKQEPFGKFMYDRAYVNKPLNVTLPVPELALEEESIAELLESHNSDYTSAHFGKWHLGTSPGKHGYEFFSGNTSNVEGNKNEPDPKRTAEVTSEAIEFLEQQAKAGSPFFMQVSYYAVHTPVIARKDTLDRYHEAQYARQKANKLFPIPKHNHVAYAAMTEELDEGLDGIMEAVDRLGLGESTYIIYTSDNGGEVESAITNNFPLARGKTTVWEGGIRVPFIVTGPGIAAGSQVDRPVIGHDILPTIAQWAGIDQVSSDIDGESLVPALAGADSNRAEGLVWLYGGYRNDKHVRPQAAIRQGQYKLIWDYESDTPHLFDLSLDLAETTNLSAYYPGVVERLKKELDAHLTETEVAIPTRNTEYKPETDPGFNYRTDRNAPKSEGMPF